MEITDKNGHKVRPQAYRREKNIFIGAAITVCGVVWLLYNFDIVGAKFFDRFFSWQVLLMALGGYFLVFRKWIAGAALLLTGFSFAMADWYDLMLPVRQVILPMLLIAAGIAVMLQKRY